MNDFKETKFENTNLYLYSNMFKERDMSFYDNIINYFKNLTLISMHISQYPYLLNLLSFQEIRDILKVKIADNLFQNNNKDILATFDKIAKKINENENILEDTKNLKDIHKFCLSSIYHDFGYKKEKGIIFDFYQIINFLRDFDFCLKMQTYMEYGRFNNKKHNVINEIYFSLDLSEKRFSIYVSYISQIIIHNDFNKEEQNNLNNTLTIRDFIIVGNKQFQKKIKIIENDFKAKSLTYLQIEQIWKYINEKNNIIKKKEKNENLISYYYYLIIEYEDYQNNLDKIFLLSMELGITFLIILYVKDDNKCLKPINFILPTILIYSTEDIKYYFSQKLNFVFPKIDEQTISNAFNIKLPIISFESDKDKYKNGCFELAETFDINIIKNKFNLAFFGEVDYANDIWENIYNIYKEHNSLNIFLEKNCIYFGFKLYPELFYFDICFIKRILYMYCREELEAEKSFYRIINDDLRTRDPLKISKYINLLALTYKLIENEELACFKGKVYRATKLDENLIFKLNPGTIMVNTTFWSTSKDFDVAESFMENDEWRNSFIICKTFKNNIDIDLENLNPYDEKEVLFLPYTEFRVEKISFEKKYGKKIFNIELNELGNRNIINFDNMHIENVNANSIDVKTLVEKYCENQEKEK